MIVPLLWFFVFINLAVAGAMAPGLHWLLAPAAVLLVARAVLGTLRKRRSEGRRRWGAAGRVGPDLTAPTSDSSSLRSPQPVRFRVTPPEAGVDGAKGRSRPSRAT